MKSTILAMSSEKRIFHYIYLLREREFVSLKQSVFKIGKTTQPPNKRLVGYPKGSEIIMVITVKNCHDTEKLILRRFDEIFDRQYQIGREYYKGCKYSMIKEMFNICEQDFPYLIKHDKTLPSNNDGVISKLTNGFKNMFISNKTKKINSLDKFKFSGLKI